MILASLARFADEQGLCAAEALESREVRWAVEFDASGRFVGVHDLATEVVRGTPRAPKRDVPRPLPGARTTSRPDPTPLVGNSTFVFGEDWTDDASKRKAPVELKRRADDFAALVERMTVSGDPALAALGKFLASAERAKAAEAARAAGAEPGQLFVFRFADDDGALVHERPVVAQQLERLRVECETVPGMPVGECVVSGVVGPLAEKHPPLRGVPGANPTGSALVSFNASAFESFGLERNANAPVSRAVAQRYTTALNRLLSDRWPDPREPGRTLPKQYCRLSDSTVALFWSAGDTEVAPWIPRLVEQGDPETVRRLYALPSSGGRLLRVGAPTVHTLVLAGAQARATVLAYWRGDANDVAAHLQAYVRDLRLPDDADDVCPPVWALLSVLSASGKASDAPPGLATELVLAAVGGRPFPRSVLAAAVSRVRSAPAGAGPVHRARVSLIQAWLRRAARAARRDDAEEVTAGMDSTNVNIAYLCGRLFAALERLQAVALPNIDAGIGSRYYASAAASPMTVFPRLLRGRFHHLAKGMDGPHAGGAVLADRVLEEVAAKLGDAHGAFPARLSLEDQGRFALGYFAQRSEFFRPRASGPGSSGSS